jgi:murein DD-endopeptidase MepM/ murein hydrolase activator NlpD
VTESPRFLVRLALFGLAALTLTACDDGIEVPEPTATSRAVVAAPTAPAVPTAAATEPAPTEAPATATPTVEPAGAIEPLATPTEAPPEPPATAEPPLTPAAAVEFNPPQLVLGGAVLAYLNQPATAATLTFGGLQYPMLFDGARWWAIIGVGAFAELGVAPVTIAYNPADGSPQTAVESAIEITYREFPVENIELDPGTASLLDPAIVNNEEALRSAIFSGYTTQRLWDGAFVTPADGPLSSIYGVARSYNGAPVSSYHRGTDFAGTTGDPAYAAAAGRVVFAQELQVRGNTVIIDHGVGVFTAYGHLSAITVAEGDVVTARQNIGQIGSTGLVTGPHLHWEVVVRGVEVDGELWLSGAAGQ